VAVGAIREHLAPINVRAPPSRCAIKAGFGRRSPPAQTHVPIAYALKAARPASSAARISWCRPALQPGCGKTAGPASTRAVQALAPVSAHPETDAVPKIPSRLAARSPSGATSKPALGAAPPVPAASAWLPAWPLVKTVPIRKPRAVRAPSAFLPTGARPPRAGPYRAPRSRAPAPPPPIAVRDSIARGANAWRAVKLAWKTQKTAPVGEPRWRRAVLEPYAGR
jgi:hypothetical protein